MTQEKEQLRRYAADHAFGVGVSMKLLGVGLQCNVPPDAIDETIRARLKTVYSTIEQVAKELTLIAKDIWALEERGGEGLRDTKIEF
ncbi:MAG: hypothetical protein HQ567_19495 [Candidatus Nealsonbacteria bacterium]|nr:hypothetical protein [Candidatus Nealsonbacteria bacterium]